jgi:hypothetical protein
MSFDLVIWKHSARTKTAMIQECYDAIINNKDHTAMDFFNEYILLNDFEIEFGKRQKDYFGGEVDNCPFLYSTGREEFGNWIIMNLNWSTHQETKNKIVAIALKHGLMVYDPQQKVVWGNKRPPKM